MEKLDSQYPAAALAEALEVSESGFAAQRRKALRPRRQHDAQLTLYKSLGHVVQDLAAAAYVHRRARAALESPA